MKWVLILWLATSGEKIETQDYFDTLQECEAKGQSILRGQKMLKTFSNYRCDKLPPKKKGGA